MKATPMASGFSHTHTTLYGQHHYLKSKPMHTPRVIIVVAERGLVWTPKSFVCSNLPAFISGVENDFVLAP